jgi:hypothetical protein
VSEGFVLSTEFGDARLDGIVHDPGLGSGLQNRRKGNHAEPPEEPRPWQWRLGAETLVTGR